MPRLTEKWIPRRPDYYVQTGGMHENPYGVPKDEIVRFILDNSPEVVAQVVFGKYVEASGLVFKAEAIERMTDRKWEPVLGNSWVDREARERAAAQRRFYGDAGSPFHTGIDFARQTDFTVISTIDTTTLPAQLVYFKRLNRVPWETIYGEVGKAAYLWGPNLLCDGSGPGGDVVMDALESRWYCAQHDKSLIIGQRCVRDGRMLGCKPHDYVPLSVAEAFYFTGTTKKELVEHLRNCTEAGYDRQNPEKPFGWLRTPPIPQLQEELAFYAWDDKKLMTDCVFSLALAAWSGLEDPLDDPDYGSVYGQ